ncbi:hypothetical protein FA15DRAFT_710431 [Coprinopsis marcescibilis]|uniref:Nephrocystin 3-like N-terminal domain-containing protein n=1 Tax=Coprinopsis marcescibilis TaxID=230819 RepID=A0A5C3KD29_COPMA|nr:hypothetical protein FA15DRAFT_710431 [Coprinopsis marcescibilis]
MALPPPAPKEDMGNRVMHQVGTLVNGGILNNAQGVHIEGSATLISARNYTTVYNTMVQPDISEKDMALFEKIVEWLSHINYHAIQADNNGKRAEGTGAWAFDNPKIASAGKTVLAYVASFLIIIDHLLQEARANKRICVTFEFSHYTDQFTGDKVLGGLLCQVIQDHSSTIAFVKPMYNYHHQRKTQPSQKELLDVIRAIFNSDLFDEKFCALDGLDKAFEDTQVDVLDALAGLPANLLLMSRPLPLLKDHVPNAVFMDITLHEANIIQMIEDKIGCMPRLQNLLQKGDQKQKVVKTVHERSLGMFLVASLQLNMLSSCINVKSLDTALQALPVGVNAMYEATTDCINGGPAPKLALGALTLVAYAWELLKMDDLLHALAVETDPFKYDSNLMADPDTVLSACCGLITFEPETKLVHLVHYTAQDFLVTYLPKSININAKEPETGNGEGDSALTHAAWYGQLDAVQLLLGFDGIDVNASHWEYGTALAQASAQGHIDIVKCLLQQENIDVNFSQCQEGSALMQAAYMGHKDVVELLLQQEEIDVNATRPDGHSALSLALGEISWRPNKPRSEIAELLWAHGAQ